LHEAFRVITSYFVQVQGVDFEIDLGAVLNFRFLLANRSFTFIILATLGLEMQYPHF